MADYTNRTKYDIGDTIRGFEYLGEETWYEDPNGRIIIKAKFRCHCGKEFIGRVYGIESNCTKSCGCLRLEGMRKRFTTHGLSNTPEYSAWDSMKARCYYTKGIQYSDYGGRGITVCDRWRNSFENFLEDMGNKPSPKHSLDRVDVDGNYEPGNCKWSTKQEQAENHRRNINVTYKGKTKCLTAWAKEKGISPYVVLGRVRASNWDPIKALETPVGNYTKTGKYVNKIH